MQDSPLLKFVNLTYKITKRGKNKPKAILGVRITCLVFY